MGTNIHMTEQKIQHMQVDCASVFAANCSVEKMEIGIGIQKGLELQLKLQPGNQSARRMKKKRCMMEFLN